jgi:hypothetical protein
MPKNRASLTEHVLTGWPHTSDGVHRDWLIDDFNRTGKRGIQCRQIERWTPHKLGTFLGLNANDEFHPVAANHAEGDRGKELDPGNPRYKTVGNPFVAINRNVGAIAKVPKGNPEGFINIGPQMKSGEELESHEGECPAAFG